MLQLSIIIVNWNTRDFLRDCLQSIYQNSPREEPEIFVVDNASTDGSPEMVGKEFPLVKLIGNKDNVGFARANNQAIRKASGKHLLLLNSDTVLKPKVLDTMIEFMSTHPQVGVMGPRLVELDGKQEEACGYFPTPWAIFLTRVRRRSKIFNRWLRNLPASHLVPERAQEVDWVTGACLMVRDEVVKQVGLLDEDMFMYFEDVDWCYRIKKAGWRIFFFPEAEVIHARGESIKKSPRKIAMHYRKSQYYLYRKHLSWPNFILLKSIINLYLLLKIMWLRVKLLTRPKQVKDVREELSLYWEIIRL